MPDPTHTTHSLLEYAAIVKRLGNTVLAVTTSGLTWRRPDGTVDSMTFDPISGAPRFRILSRLDAATRSNHK